MKCQAHNLTKLLGKHLQSEMCENEATHISYEHGCGFCDEHYELLKEYQPDFIELSGKYYPAVRELKLVEL